MAIELIHRLIDELNESDVLYCHWKSNFSLEETLSGCTDLDLLVDRQCFPTALLILTNLGFKSAIMRSRKMMPGIYHYYGLDLETGQLVHVHLFTRILTGESFIKSHLFPFEAMLFEDLYEIEGIRVPSKSAELALFILRTFIKYGSLLDLVYLVRADEKIGLELQWLQAGHDLSKALRLIRQYCPAIEDDLFVECVNVLSNSTLIIHKWLLAQRVRQRLRIYAINAALEQDWLNLQLVLEQAWQYRGRSKKNKALASGGMVIAFIGPEATGKSTLVSECEHWLGTVFAVEAIHAGKPPSSRLTTPISTFIPLIRRLFPHLRTSRLENHAAFPEAGQSSKQSTGLISVIYALRAVTIAWDRRRLLIGARRSAGNGRIIICDRYPSGEVGQMDSPRLREDPARQGLMGSIYNRLARFEGRLYQEIAPPDIALRLNVALDTAIRRNRERIKPGKETDAYLESRHRESRRWNRAGTRYIYDINTERPLNETILSVKKAIWKSL